MRKTLVYKKRYAITYCVTNILNKCSAKEISSFAIIVFGEQSIYYAKNSKCIIEPVHLF